MKSLSMIIACIVTLSLAGAVYAQTELVSDNFAGTNGTFLDSNWTGCGYNYGAYSKLTYENNQAGGSGYWGQDCALYTGYGTFPSDQYATATVVAPTPSNSRQASIQLRANATPSTDEAYIACGWDAQDFPADYHYRIWSLTPGAPGPVSLWLGNITPATNDVISCQVLGNIVTMSLNGQKIATVTDTSGITSGYPGLYYNDGANSGGPSPTDVIFASFQAGSGPSVVSTSISPLSETVSAGSFVQYSGTITYADGTVATMNNWSSSDTTVATVDITGTAYGTGAGTATLKGSSGPDNVSGTLNVVAPEGYTPLVYDTFVGTGGGYLGSNWKGCGFDGGSYSELVYQNNQAGGSGYWSQDCAVYTGYGAFPNDQYATALVVDPSPGSSPEAVLELRGNANPGTPESYIGCGWDAQDFPSDQHYRIWSLAPNGTPTNLYLSNITPATNDVIWCQVLGNTVTMQVNGTTIAVVDDTSGLTSGYPGIFFIDPNGDVPPVTDVIFDNFSAGSIDNPVIASVVVSPNPSTTTIGSPVQFTATATYTDGTVTSNSNSVNWSSSDSSVATINSSGLATPVGGGTATITASSGAVGGMANLTVNQVSSPTVTFIGAPASASYNSSFTVTATTNASTMPQIIGTPGVCNVGAVSGTPANASAQIAMTSGTGTCTLTASWAASANYQSASLMQNTAAVKLATTTSITSYAPNPSTLQQAVTISFSASGAGAGPTGLVTVTASTGESCSGVATAGSCSITFTSAGTRTLTAGYPGDSNFSSSTSAGVSQTVNTPIVSLSPTSIGYGSVSRGHTSTKSETVTNTGAGALINFSRSIAGTNASMFTISSTTCGTTLSPGASCVIKVTFKPTTTGTLTASLRLTDNAANSPQSVPLSGTGK